MKKTETRVREVHETVVTYVHCDFCENEIQNVSGKHLEHMMSEIYNFSPGGMMPYIDVTVQIKMSNGYPESSESRTIELDVCPQCFKTEIISRAKHTTVTYLEY